MAYVDRKTFYAIKNKLTPKENELIAFYELQWALRNRVPTIDEVAKQIKQTHVTVNYYLQRAPVKQALNRRGIPWQQHSQEELTSQQVACAVVMMNFADERPNKDKLSELGVNETQYAAWLQDPNFKNLVDVIADRNLTNIRPAAITEFTKKINSGDWNAIKYYLDATGTVQSNDAPQSEQLIMKFVEIIQRHVKDPAIMVAIAADLKAASHNRTLDVVEPVPALEGHVVEDAELIAAKKMIGFA